MSNSSQYIDSPFCQFLSHVAADGGVLYLKDDSRYSDSSHCVFASNNALNSGGVIYISDGSVYERSTNCTFSQNIASNKGGSILATMGAAYKDCQNSTFELGQANFGGAIMLENGSVYQNGSYSIFQRNRGGHHAGCIFALHNSSIVDFHDSQFHFNEALIGGAISLENNSSFTLQIYKNRFFSN